MIRVFNITLFLIFASLLLTGCFNNEQITEELIEYHNDEWRKLQEIKKENSGPILTEYYTLALNENDQGIEKLLREEFLPLQKEVVEHLEEIYLESKEVEKLNQLQLEAEKFGYEILKEQADIIHGGNLIEIDEMYERFNQYQKELEEKYAEVEEKREKLMEKYDVELIKETDEKGNNVMKMVRKEERD